MKAVILAAAYKVNDCFHVALVYGDVVRNCVSMEQNLFFSWEIFKGHLTRAPGLYNHDISATDMEKEGNWCGKTL